MLKKDLSLLTHHWQNSLWEKLKVMNLMQHFLVEVKTFEVLKVYYKEIEL